jgi:hypothetical protein
VQQAGRERDADDAADEREHDALGDELPDDLAAAATAP